MAATIKINCHVRETDILQYGGMPFYSLEFTARQNANSLLDNQFPIVKEDYIDFRLKDYDSWFSSQDIFRFGEDYLQLQGRKFASEYIYGFWSQLVDKRDASLLIGTDDSGLDNLIANDRLRPISILGADSPQFLIADLASYRGNSFDYCSKNIFKNSEYSIAGADIQNVELIMQGRSPMHYLEKMEMILGKYISINNGLINDCGSKEDRSYFSLFDKFSKRDIEESAISLAEFLTYNKSASAIFSGHIGKSKKKLLQFFTKLYDSINHVAIFYPSDRLIGQE